MKIVVYAICKNEEKFAERWMNSMSEADAVYVTDTGSTDNTVKKLQSLGAVVRTANINPWRFDEARNISLSFVPEDADICVCTDLDEAFEKGWRNELEKVWKKGITTRARYNYTWSFNSDGSPAVSFYIEKIHSRHGFKWIHPVHEVLKYEGKLPDVYANADKIQLNHYPDNTKSRGQYLELLELSVKEDPEDDRNMHYLGREYMFYGKWDECINTLKKHLDLKSAVWADERAASMRYIARAYKNKNDYLSASSWLYRAIAEAPYLREGWVEAALLGYDEKNWEKVYFMANEALKINERPKTYINEGFCWDFTPYDLIAVSAYYLGLYDKALSYAKTALSMDENNERLKNNLEIIQTRNNVQTGDEPLSDY